MADALIPSDEAAREADKAARRARTKAKRYAYNLAYYRSDKNGVKAKTSAYQKAYYAANRDRVKARVKAYKSKHVERYKEADRQRRIDPIKSKHDRAKIKEWATANKDHKRAYLAAYHETNKARIKLQKLRYRRDNPEKFRITRRMTAQRRRAAKKVSVERIRQSDVVDIMARQRQKCAICKCSIRAKFEVDHIIPIALGGPHERRNIQLTCPPCNKKKSAKHPLEFMREQGLLL